MRAMAVTVVGSLSVIDGRETGNHSTGELRMCRADSGVDDVRLHARAGSVVSVISVKRQVALVYTIKSPGCAALNCRSSHFSVLLDKCHPRILGQSSRLRFAHAHGETFQSAAMRVIITAVAGIVLCK